MILNRYIRTLIECGHVVQLRIDLANLNMSLNYKTIIRHGEVMPTVTDRYDEVSLCDYFTEETTLDEVLAETVRRHRSYRHSRPSAADDRVRHTFTALPYDLLSPEDQAFGPGRTVARFDLEYYLLCAIITGHLVWDSTRPDMNPKYWFWTPERGSTLALKREWFVVA